MTAFIITRDYIDPADPAEGVMGPRNMSEDDERRLKQGEGIEFRLRDDDRNLYYKGRRLETSDADADYLSETELAPLDCFGAPNAGCTIQEEKNSDGKWESIN
jgi:hypothetical protein